jgi:hypothetical protein
MNSPRITAYNIHDLVFKNLRIPEDYINVLHDPRRKVYIKFTSINKMTEHLEAIQGTREYKQDNGEVSIVQVRQVGLGYRSVRVASFPPEVQDTALNAVMSQFGEVKMTTEKKWSSTYRYKAPIGVLIVNIELKKDIPSKLHVSGNRVFLNYDGHPITCFNCTEIGQQARECPYRRNAHPRTKQPSTGTWVSVVQNCTQYTKSDAKAPAPQENSNDTPTPKVVIPIRSP